MKKITGLLASLLLLPLISARYFSYFSLESFISSINPATITIIVAFITFFAMLHILVFSNMFKGKTAVSAIVSIAISFLAIYWMVQKGWYLSEEYITPLLIFIVVFGIVALLLAKGFKINKSFAGVVSLIIAGLVAYGSYDLGYGVPSDWLYPVIWIIFTITAIIVIWKAGFSIFLSSIGVILLLISIFTDIFYESGTAILIGAILLLIGLWLWNKKRKTHKGERKILSRKSNKDKKTGLNIMRQTQTKKPGFWSKHRPRYDAEAEKRQRKAIKEKSRKVKNFGKEQWQAEKDAMRKRKEKIRQIKENRKRKKQLKKRYKKIIKRLSTMPVGKNIKKGSEGYREYISLYREAESIRKELGI